MGRLEDDPLYRAKPLACSNESLTNEEIDALIYDLPRKCHSERSEESQPAKRWVAAPQASLPGAPSVQGVALAPNEDVQWLWTHTPNGSYVSGYNIVRALPKKRQRPFATLRVTKIEKGG